MAKKSNFQVSFRLLTVSKDNMNRPLKSCHCFVVCTMLFMPLFGVLDLTRFLNGKFEQGFQKIISIMFCGNQISSEPCIFCFVYIFS